MPLREEFARSGAWLFRWRSYLPLLLLVLVFTQMPGFTYVGDSHTLEHVWEAFCLAVGFLGLGIRFHTVGHAARGTSGRNTRSQQAQELNTSGWYSVVRHPLYLGNFFMWLAVALFVYRWWLVLVVVLIFWLYYERIMFAEEEWLRSRFGEDYLRWAQHTPAIVPNFRLWRSPELPFSLRKALRGEYSGFFGLIAVLTVLVVTGEYVVTGRLFIEPAWAVLFLIGLVSYLSLLILKRRTDVLRGPDR